MKIALYGMPCAGKTFFMEKITNARVVHGSQTLEKICKGVFSELTEEEQNNARIRYTEYINSLEDEVIISDGHYSFMEKVVFTEADGALYDVFLYLYCRPETLKKRYQESEKNQVYAEEAVAVIEEWQQFEIHSLRKECHKRNKDFYVVSDMETGDCSFTEFLAYVKNGFSAYKTAENLCRKIRKWYPAPCRLSIADGDKTIIRQDSFRFCCNGETKVFDGNFYTGYQSFLFWKELQESGLDKGRFDEEKIAAIEINEPLWTEVRNHNYVILSSGIESLWKKIGQYKGIDYIVADPLISADTKYYIVKLLKEQGYTISAYGDSKIDLDMLREADKGMLYIGDRMSKSLEGESLKNLHLIYHHNLYVLEDEMREEIADEIAICKSDSGIHGKQLVNAHIRLGKLLGEKMLRVIPERGTALLVLERGGKFFGAGLASAFGEKFYFIDPKKDRLPDIQADRIVIVDAVIHSGATILDMIAEIKANNPDTDIILAANVIQKDSLALFQDYQVYVVRISANFFVGKNQSKQVGKTGPDTADRLFNLIEKKFVY